MVDVVGNVPLLAVTATVAIPAHPIRSLDAKEIVRRYVCRDRMRGAMCTVRRGLFKLDDLFTFAERQDTVLWCRV